jgi:inhibitor of cysteine peptidase
MVQKELKSKTKLYALAAVLSALMLIGTIYTITSPTVMYTITGISPMKNFSSVDELRNYLTTNTQGDSVSYAGGPLDVLQRPTIGSAGPAGPQSALGIENAPPPNPETGTYSVGATKDYSTTNVQVTGVDEADTVKTDGQYIYTLNVNYTVEPSSTVEIIKADPADPSVVGEIAFNNSVNLAGMYLSGNGDKLAVLGSKYGNAIYLPKPVEGNTELTYDYYANVVKTFIYVYDVSYKADPVLTRNLTLTGSYFNSRMINDHLYIVVSQPAYANNETVILPQVCNDAVTQEVTPNRIYYADMKDNYFSYTTFAGVNLLEDSQAPTDMTILMGSTSNMYVSTGNMYVTFPSTVDESTEIYRIAIDGANLSFDAKGIVPGYVLNQYSMDEYNGYFRVATTVSTGSWVNRDQHNNLYVLDMNLDVTGKIENLAQGERIYSARFAGDKAYLVTFKQIDPFFVLDLKNPTAPTVAGELKIPGYSSYLHPYDENHVIGIGKENNTVKLSFFDVSDMNNPKEIAKYVIGDNADYADSNALYEPKAFLFDLQKQLLVIPASITNYGIMQPEPKTSSGSVSSSREDQQSANAPFKPSESSYWQGACVFRLSVNGGFTLQGTVSHQSTDNSNWYYNDDAITRSLYIDNTLYTVSNNKVQLNSLDNLSLIAQVNF